MPDRRIVSVRYINLEDRRDRRAHMEELLEESPWPSARVDAVRLDGPPEDHGIKMNERYVGAIGVASVFLSHIRTLEAFLTEPEDGLFVLLEDDVHFTPDFLAKGVLALDMPEAWDVMMVSPRFRWRDPERSGLFGLGIYHKLRRILRGNFTRPIANKGVVRLQDWTDRFHVSGSHFTVFRSRDAVQRILDHMRAVPEIYYIDNYYVKDCDALGVDSPEVWAGSYGSDIPNPALKA